MMTNNNITNAETQGTEQLLRSSSSASPSTSSAVVPSALLGAILAELEFKARAHRELEFMQRAIYLGNSSRCASDAMRGFTSSVPNYSVLSALATSQLRCLALPALAANAVDSYSPAIVLSPRPVSSSPHSSTTSSSLLKLAVLASLTGNSIKID
jgi:hypothetical protein